MAATDLMIQEVRENAAEVDPTSQFSDARIKEIIEQYPLVDELGQMPWYWTPMIYGQPPSKTDNPNWLPSYDLNQATAEIWKKKAAALADQYDFSSDGQNYKRGQLFENAKKQELFYRSRRAAKSRRVHPYTGNERKRGYVANSYGGPDGSWY